MRKRLIFVGFLRVWSQENIAISFLFHLDLLCIGYVVKSCDTSYLALFPVVYDWRHVQIKEESKTDKVMRMSLSMFGIDFDTNGKRRISSSCWFKSFLKPISIRTVTVKHLKRNFSGRLSHVLSSTTQILLLTFISKFLFDYVWLLEK